MEMREQFVETQRELEREYTEQERVHATAMAFMQEAAKAIPYFNHQFRGELIALAIGARPAVGFGKHDDPKQQVNAAALERAAKKIGGLELVGQFLMNPRKVAARVAAEPELAAEVGWDPNATVAENVARATSHYKSPVKTQQLFAFILGFPATAIRDYPETLQRTAYGTRPDPEVRGVQITDASGESVYVFRVVGALHEQAPDVQHLRERVRRTFAEAGFIKKQSPSN